MSNVEERDGKLVLVDGDEVSEKGSFNWYLCPQGGGGFVKAMCNAIQRADADNLPRLAAGFPQMVAAFIEPSWCKAPEGFEPRYDAGGAEAARRVIGELAVRRRARP